MNPNAHQSTPQLPSHSTMLTLRQMHSKRRFSLAGLPHYYVILGFDDDADVERYMLHVVEGMDEPRPFFTPSECSRVLGIPLGEPFAELGGYCYGQWQWGVSRDHLLTLMNNRGFVEGV